MNTIDNQKAVLGAVILSENAYMDLAESLQPFMFDKGIMEKFAGWIWARRAAREGIDPGMARSGYLNAVGVDVKQPTGEDGGLGQVLKSVTGDTTVEEMIRMASSRRMLPEHADKIREGWMQREFLRIANEGQQKIADGEEYFSVSEYVRKQMEVVAEQADVSTNEKEHEIDAAVASVFDAANHEEGVSGVPTGFLSMNRFTAGWQKGDLVIVMARPGMGKTTVMSEFALAAAAAGHKVAFFSLGDLTSMQLYKKQISMLAGIPGGVMRSGKLSPQQSARLIEAADWMRNAPIEVFDASDLRARTVAAIQDKVRAMNAHSGRPFELVIVDYLQQLKSDNKRNSRYVEVADVTRDLKAAAGILDVPIIAGSQINRGVETRGGTKRPEISDSRDSGTIEEDADSILAIYRPAYYEIFEDEEGNNIRHLTEILHKKDRIAGDLLPHTYRLWWHESRLHDEDALEEQGNGILDALMRSPGRGSAHGGEANGSPPVPENTTIPAGHGGYAADDEDLPF